MSKKFEVDIIKLEYPHNVRQKMGMFGCDGTNADILFREIVDNTVDLATKFKLSLDVKSWINQNEWNVVLDNGLGFPIYRDMDYPEEDVCIVRDMMRKINVGSNFHQTEYSTGQNGVGSRLTQAISEDFILISNALKKDESTLPKFIQEGLKAGKSIYVWHSKKGLASNETVMSKQEFVEYCKDLIGDKITKNLNQFLEEIDEKEFGTMVMFKPDAELLDSTKVSYKGYPFAIIKSLFQYDSDFKDIKLNFELNGKEIKPYEFTQDFKDNLIQDKVFTCAVSVKTEDVKPIKFIFQTAWTLDKFNTEVNGSVNLLETPSGKHLNIVQTAIGQAFVKYNSLLKYQDSRYGLRLFVLNMALKPLFNSQDKTKLSKWEDIGYDERATIQAISDAFYKVMKSNTEFFDVLCARILEYKRATEKLSNIELLKSKIVLGDEGDKRRIQSGEMSKVYECTSNDFSKRELYITEGLSASSGLVTNRDKRFQSILPLRGKLINTSGFDEEKLVSNKEVTAIINTIGCGIGGITDISKSRYGKIIISTDLDDDGCLTAATKIPLLDGRVVPISELEKEKEFWVYSCTEDGKVVPGKGHSARVTKTVNKLYRITLDNGEVVECTDNHPFMLRSGEFKRADLLSVGDSLMPFYRKVRNENFMGGYEEVLNPKTNSYRFTHHVVDNYFNGEKPKGIHVHHVDHNKLNNSPENLKRMTSSDHHSYHSKQSYLVTEYNPSGVHGKLISELHKNGHYEGTSNFIKYNKTDAHSKNISDHHKNGTYAHCYFHTNGYNGSEKNSETATKRNLAMWNSTETYRDGMTYSEWMSKQLSERSEETLKVLSENCSNQWKDEEISYNMQFSRCCSVILDCIEKFGELSEKGYNLLKPRTGVPRYSSLFEKFGDQTNLDILIRTKQFVDKFPNKLQGFPNATEYFKEFNHSIISIEVVELESPIEVWDITVEEHHNFALESGCFVHNSHIANLVTGLFMQHCPELVKAGMVYKLDAPFYRVTDKKGKVSYFYHDQKDQIDFSNCKVDKLKGLGSYNDKETKEFLMSPESRRLIKLEYNEDHQVEIDDAVTLLFSAAKRKQLMIDSGIFVEGQIK